MILDAWNIVTAMDWFEDINEPDMARVAQGGVDALISCD